MTEVEKAINQQGSLTFSTVQTLTTIGIPTTPLSTSWTALTEYIDGLLGQFLSELLFAAPHDFSAYCEYMSPEEPPGSRLHQLFCETLTAVEAREIQRVAVSVPPGAAKSHYWSRMFPTWYLGRNPNHKYLSAAHSQTFAANELGKKCRAIISSDEYRDVFPNTKLDPNSRAAESWGLSNGKGAYQTKGIGQAIAGYRANIGGLDDPFGSRADAESATIRDAAWAWYLDDFMTRMLPESPVAVVATRWHSQDIIGRIEEQNAEGKGIPYTIINLPALCEKDNILGLPEGESIWPEFYKKSFYLEKKETLSVKGWGSLYCGKPIDAAGGVVQSDWLFRYKSLPGGEGNDVKIRKIVLSIDSANTAKERSDWTVIQVWVQGTDGRHYLADVIRRQVEFEGLTTLMDRVSAFWKANVILVEDRGSGTQLLQVRGATSSTPSPIPLVPISTKNLSKEFRMDAVTPMFSGGLVLLPETASWLTDYETEILSFPHGKHKDTIDSTSQYLEWARHRAKLGTRKLRTR